MKKETNKNTTGTKADAIQPKKYAVEMTDSEEKKVIKLVDDIVKGTASYKAKCRALYSKGVTYQQIVALLEARKGLKAEKLAKIKSATATVRTDLFKTERDAILKAASKATKNKELSFKDVFGMEEPQEHKTSEGKERIRNGGELIILAMNDLAGVKRDDKTSFGCSLDSNPSLQELVNGIIHFTIGGESLATIWENESMTNIARADVLKALTRGIGNQLQGPLADDWKAANDSVSQADKKAREAEKKAKADKKAEEKAEAEAEAEALRQERMKEIFSTLLKGKPMLEFAASDMGKKELPANIKPAGMKKLIESQRQKVALLTESKPTKAGKALAKNLNAMRNELNLTEYVKPSWQVK